MINNYFVHNIFLFNEFTQDNAFLAHSFDYIIKLRVFTH